MSESMHRTRPEAKIPSSRITGRGKAALVAVSFALGVPTGAVVDDLFDARAANNAQPNCEVPVGPGGNISDIRNDLRNAGDNNFELHQVVDINGNVRNLNLKDGRNVQPTDLAIFEHVDPAACAAAGGVQDASKL